MRLRLLSSRVWGIALGMIVGGCASPLPEDAFIRARLLTPEPVETGTTPAELPAAPRLGLVEQPGSEVPLTPKEVRDSVERHFPLLLAVEQDRVIAAGQVLAAEGAFDLNLRSKYTNQFGSFENDRFDILAEQPLAAGGGSIFTGYRFGFGSFPVYYGDRYTATGGEARAGIQLPLLRDSAIDRRRAALRQAQIQRNIADPVIRRARLDYHRNATKTYWNWVGVGEQYRVADALNRIAMERQKGLELQFKQGQVNEFVVIDGRRILAEREGALFGTERRWQQASFEVSLFLRDDAGNPVVPDASRLPKGFPTSAPPIPQADKLAESVEIAFSQRPELVRFGLLRERAGVDLALAQNQTLPGLNAGFAGAQDMGEAKKGSGSLAPDLSTFEGFVSLDLPLQRREARGRVQMAQGQIAQLTAQERFARDQIRAEVQDAVSGLDRTYQRWTRAVQELKVSQRVAELERERFRLGQSNLLEVNLRELAAAQAQAKVIESLTEYFRTFADYAAAIGSTE
ncbi:MAG: TolC family protein [Gemmataceae bacterium]|nr:TolC family protein [Gemmataceae bacterium]